MLAITELSCLVISNELEYMVYHTASLLLFQFLAALTHFCAFELITVCRTASETTQARLFKLT